MLKRLEEFESYVKIAGFQNVNIKDSRKLLESITKQKPAAVETQLFDAELVATWQHIYFAVLNASTAFKNKTNISKSLAMETILYAACEHQITKATEKMGIMSSTLNVAVLIVGNDLKKIESALSLISGHIGGKQNDKVVALSKPKSKVIKESFRISEKELETVIENNEPDKALVDLIVERMALLSTER